MAAEPAGTFSDVRLRAFVDAVFDAYYDWHIESGRMDMSSQMDALLRLAPGELPRTFDGWRERVHPDDRAEALEANLLAALQGDVYDDYYRMRRGDGTDIFVHDRGVIIKEPDGTPAHMIGAIRDITVEREAERAQREAAELYFSLFAQTVNPAYRIAEDGRFLDANDAGLAFLEIGRRRLARERVATLWGADAAEAVATALSGASPAASLDLELQVGESLRALAVTLVPCLVGGRRNCFALGTDVTAHRALSRALEASQGSLRNQAEALEDANTALRVLLEQRNRDRRELEHTVVANAEVSIVPLLETLRRRLAGAPEAIYADAAIANLRELVQPFAQALDSLVGGGARLSRREREVADLIRAGKSSREIAEALVVSPATVAFHCKNLRRKLGLTGRGPSLATYLASVSRREGPPESPQ
jgi:DNA-binding CsgD family transcriptional regulator/PAS domain-containing protein